MQGAETFLRNRKWILHSTTNLREAIAYVLQKQPAYVMITSDHPNKKVGVLPKMLVSAVPSKIIGFSEKGSGQSTKNLMAMSLEYNLYPPVSGPAIERMILKIKKDEETKNIQKAQRAAGGGSTANSDDDLITFKSENNSDSNRAINLSGARAALSSLIDSNDPDEESSDSDTAIASGGSDAGGPSYVGGTNSDEGAGYGSGNYGDSDQTHGGSHLQKGAAYNPGEDQMGGSAQGRGAGYNPNHQGSGGGPRGYNPQQGGAGGHGHYNPQQQGSGAGTGSYNPQQGGTGGLSGYMGGSGNFDPATGGYPPGTPLNPDGTPVDPNIARNQEYFNRENNGQPPSGSGNFTGGPGGGSGIQGQDDEDGISPVPGKERTPHFRNKREEVSYQGSDNKDEGPYKFETESEKRDPSKKDSILVQGAENALTESVNLVGKERVKEKVEKASDIACITVESPRFSGYLICAFGKARKVDKELIEVLQNRLFGFLKSNGEDIKDKKLMNLKIQEVDFTSWALSQAEFLKKSVHNGEEIAIAFFPKDVSDIELSDSASKKMVQIGLDDLKEEAKVEFDLYIYMPANNKYILYTAKGQPFYEKQKGRLKTSGVKHMHLKKDEVHEVRRYQAQNFLNDKIQSFSKTEAKK